MFRQRQSPRIITKNDDIHKILESSTTPILLNNISISNEQIKSNVIISIFN